MIILLWEHVKSHLMTLDPLKLNHAQTEVIREHKFTVGSLHLTSAFGKVNRASLTACLHCIVSHDTSVAWFNKWLAHNHERFIKNLYITLVSLMRPASSWGYDTSHLTAAVLTWTLHLLAGLKVDLGAESLQRKGWTEHAQYNPDPPLIRASTCQTVHPLGLLPPQSPQSYEKVEMD